MLSNVKMTEIEIHSKCNRKCAWCPNKTIDRTKKINLPKDVYIKYLKELKEHNFGKNWNGGVITYSRNEEPMLDIKLLKERVKQAKEILPNALLVTNTNGDFITKEALNGLLIDELSIMDYDCKGLNWCLEKIKSLGGIITEIEYPYIYGYFNNDNKMKFVYWTDWAKTILLEDRGGYFTEENMDIKFKGKPMKWREDKGLRDFDCLDPTFFIPIDYNGNVTPCCSIRSDNPKHKDYVLGNIKEQNIVEIFFSDKAKKFRENMISGDMNKYNKPCKYCQKGIGRYTRENPSIKFK